jgi:putative transposase
MPTTQKAFKFRIYPTKNQQTFLAKHFGAVRFVYNFFLNKKKEEYLNNKKTTSYFDDAKALTQLKSEEKYFWLYEINSQTLQSSLRNLESSYLNFFRGNAKFPKFHSKKNKQCFKIPQNFSIEDGFLYIPKLKEGIKIMLHQKLLGKAISCHVSKSTTGKYFVSILCELDQPHLPRVDSAVGIDLGLKSLLVESNGNVAPSIKTNERFQKRKAFAQRNLAKKKIGSNNRAKSRAILAKHFEKEVNKRTDYLHKLSRQLVNENQVIIAETLAVKNMMQNSSLAKAIGEVSWGELLRQIQYKSEWAGRAFHKIDRFFPSSKACNNCKFVVDHLPLDVRNWDCPSCKSSLDRDLNAAKNILEKGLVDLGLQDIYGVSERNPKSKTSGGDPVRDV